MKSIFCYDVFFELHGAKHFCEKFGHSCPKGGPELFDKMYIGMMHFQHQLAMKCIDYLYDRVFKDDFNGEFDFERVRA